MDQGDNQLPMWQSDFDTNRSLVEDDWASGATKPSSPPNQPQSLDLTLTGFSDRIFTEGHEQLHPWAHDLWTPSPQQPTYLSTQQGSFQESATNPTWPMWSTLEPAALVNGLQFAAGYQSNPGTDCTNDQVGQAPSGYEWLESNAVGDALPDDCPWINGEPLMSSEFNGFNEVERLQLDQMPSIGVVEEKSATPPRSQILEGGRKAKRTKQRLVCNYHGCKSTFPRNYELERHKRNVHDRDLSVCCFVFQCRRAAKPFHRADKFSEHVRSHKNPDHFVCVIDGCPEAPLTYTELQDHLLTVHDLEHCSQPHLDLVLATVNLRRTPLRDGSVLLEEKDRCELAFLGCEHRPGLARDSHLRSHELLQRSEGYETIIALRTFGSWPRYGCCTCPICHEKLTYHRNPKDLEPSNAQFLEHLEHHSKEERALHAADISKMLRPYLIGKETLFEGHDKTPFFPVIRAELEAIGAIQAEGSIPHDEITGGNIQ